MHSNVYCLAVVLMPGLVACATSDGGAPTDTSAAPPTSSADVNPSTQSSSSVPPSTLGPIQPGPTSSVTPSVTPPTSPPGATGSTSSDAELPSSNDEPSGAVGSTDVGAGDSTASSAATAATSDREPSTSAANSEGGELTPLKVYVAGDSTVATYRDTASTTDQAGWGQMLHEYLSELAVVDNRAVGGTTSRSYIDFGHFDKIAADIAAGDTLLVQFGTNDGNKTATYDLGGQDIPYYLDPATDYKTYLGKYIELADEKGANLIFVTPPPRNSAYCTGGNGTGGHAQAMRELAAERGVALADLNGRSVDYLKAICPSPTPEDFFLLRADGSVDGTHFQENGARHLAAFVAEAIAVSAAPLSRYVLESVL